MATTRFYPAKFEKEENVYNVTFRDVPEANTCGDDFEDALEMAADALLVSMDFYIEDGRAIPMPSEAKHGEVMIALPENNIFP